MQLYSGRSGEGYASRAIYYYHYVQYNSTVAENVPTANRVLLTHTHHLVERLSGTLRKTIEVCHMVNVFLVWQYVDPPPRELMA